MFSDEDEVDYLEAITGCEVGRYTVAELEYAARKLYPGNRHRPEPARVMYARRHGLEIKPGITKAELDELLKPVAKPTVDEKITARKLGIRLPPRCTREQARELIAARKAESSSVKQT